MVSCQQEKNALHLNYELWEEGKNKYLWNVLRVDGIGDTENWTPIRVSKGIFQIIKQIIR